MGRVSNNFITVSVYLEDWLTGDTTNHIETTQIIKINLGSTCEEKTGVPKEKPSQSGVENQKTYGKWLEARYIVIIVTKCLVWSQPPIYHFGRYHNTLHLNLHLLESVKP